MSELQNRCRTSVAVIGAGHAGIEAALACARMGVDTVLFTLSLDAVANLPCNPSIGGTAKGHLVYEIDALGGEMGRAADLVTLQSRTLNLGNNVKITAGVNSPRKTQSCFKGQLPAVCYITPQIIYVNVTDCRHCVGDASVTDKV